MIENSETGEPKVASAQQSDFLIWAMGSRNRAAALLVAPSWGGVLLAVLATLIGWGATFPYFMDRFSWDQLTSYQCFVLPRNMALYCLMLAPAVAAGVLMVQRRFPGSSPMELDRAELPPKIELGYWAVTAAGCLTFIVIISQFMLFGGGWALTCRLEESYGLSGRVAVAAVIALLSPFVSIAAVTIAYRIRQSTAGRSIGLRRAVISSAPADTVTVATEPAAEPAQPAPHLAILKQAGCVATALGFFYLGYAIWDYTWGIVATGICIMILGALIFRGSLAAARFGAWLSAAWMVLSVGDILTGPLQKPLGLVVAKFHVAPLEVVFGAALTLLWGVLSIWFYVRLRAPAIQAARKAVGRTVSPPWTGFAFGALMVAWAVGFLLYMEYNGSADKARILAKAEHGANYSYQVMEYFKYGDRIIANVLGYNDRDVISVQVEWRE